MGLMEIGLGKISEAKLIATLDAGLEQTFAVEGVEDVIGFSLAQVIEVVHKMGRDLAVNIGFSGYNPKFKLLLFMHLFLLAVI